MPFTTRLLVTPAADRTWRLAEPLVYKGSHDTWTIPKGYVTDYASVPPIAAWLIPTYGRWTRAAIVHDYLLTEELPAGRICSIDADGVFRRILRELGVSTPRRWLMWAGVRWGALVGGRASEWWRTALPVLAISLAALPGMAVGALGVALGSAPLFVAEWFSPAKASPPEPSPASGVVLPTGEPVPLLDLEALRAEAARQRRAEIVQRDDRESRAAAAALRLGGTTWWDGDVLWWGREGAHSEPVDLVALEDLADREGKP